QRLVVVGVEGLAQEALDEQHALVLVVDVERSADDGEAQVAIVKLAPAQLLAALELLVEHFHRRAAAAKTLFGEEREAAEVVRRRDDLPLLPVDHRAALVCER